MQMMTSAIYGHDLAPAVLADEKGNVVRVETAASPEWLERLLRPVQCPSHAHILPMQLWCKILTKHFLRLHSPKGTGMCSRALHRDRWRRGPNPQRVSQQFCRIWACGAGLHSNGLRCWSLHKTADRGGATEGCHSWDPDAGLAARTSCCPCASSQVGPSAGCAASWTGYPPIFRCGAVQRPCGRMYEGCRPAACSSPK